MSTVFGIVQRRDDSCLLTVSLSFRNPPTIIARHGSDGCANAVKRVLKKIDGVTDIVTDVEAKSAVVTHDDSVEPQFMLEKLQKVGEKHLVD